MAKNLQIAQKKAVTGKGQLSWKAIVANIEEIDEEIEGLLANMEMDLDETVGLFRAEEVAYQQVMKTLERGMHLVRMAQTQSIRAAVKLGGVVIKK